MDADLYGNQTADASFQNLGQDGVIVSDRLREIILTINYCTLGAALNAFACAANVLNLVVFVRQGLNDAVSVSLFGLTISDILCLLTLQWMNLCFNPLFRYSDIGFDSYEVEYMSAGAPHVCFTRTTGLITAYITLERCLCIALPLKVKTLLTPKRTVVIIVIIFVTMISSTVPPYTVDTYGPKFYQERNRTLIGLIFKPNRVEVECVSLAFNNFYCYVTFFVIISSTAILVLKLNGKSRWRQETAASGKSFSATTKRDRKIAKMVVIIAAMFVVCYLPLTVIFIGFMLIPDYGFVGRYENLFHVSTSFGYMLETVNSSVSIFIYLRMSSKYRDAFYSTFFRKRSSLK